MKRKTSIILSVVLAIVLTTTVCAAYYCPGCHWQARKVVDHSGTSWDQNYHWYAEDYHYHCDHCDNDFGYGCFEGETEEHDPIARNCLTSAVHLSSGYDEYEYTYWDCSGCGYSQTKTMRIRCNGGGNCCGLSPFGVFDEETE
jgi:hypothetical protein